MPTQRPPPASWTRLILPALLLLLLTACTAATPPPRTRLGSLPFPGPFTLYTLADPDDLGVTSYRSTSHILTRHEHGHGILYTRRAGFLDLAHLRETMDWSWYASAKISHALADNQTTLDLPGYDGSPFRLTFSYPPDWPLISPQEKQSLINELSIRIGQRVAFNAMTWHEIITWYGYKTTLLLPEQQSSFTYEDTISHMVGLDAANAALRHPQSTWDQDATAALTDKLKQLGVVPRDQAAQAVALVHNQWWKDGHCIRRNLDIGQNGAPIRPWLVRGIPGPDPSPAVFFLPTLTNIHDRDFSAFWSMTIHPSLLIPAPVRNISPAPDHLIDPETHFPILIQRIRHDMQRRFGPNTDKPYDDWPPATQSTE